MTRTHVLAFIDFVLTSSAEFVTLAEADAYAHGFKHGYTLRQPVGQAHPMLYVAVLPRDQQEMHDIIPAAELERVLVEVLS